MEKFDVAAVFGVSNKMVRSYLERTEVDGKFIDALKTDRHVVVYGSSKQGKTSLLSRHVDKARAVVIECGPKTDCQAIYQSLLRQLDVRLEGTETQTTTTEGKVKSKLGLKAMIPFLGSGDTEFEVEGTRAKERDREFHLVEYNLELAQDVGELLSKIKFNKFVVLENFHYLVDEIQTELSFDLRIFQDMGIRFIILGVWREKNKLVVYNGDLTDRIAEVPVEPWHPDEFLKVIGVGASLLNITIDEQIQRDIIDASFGSIAIVQELCKSFVKISGINETQEITVVLSDPDHLQSAIQKKATDYQARHLKSLEAIAGGLVTKRPKDGKYPLILPYYTVRVIVESSLQDLLNGISRIDLHDRIRRIHHRPPRR